MNADGTDTTYCILSHSPSIVITGDEVMMLMMYDEVMRCIGIWVLPLEFIMGGSQSR